MGSEAVFLDIFHYPREINYNPLIRCEGQSENLCLSLRRHFAVKSKQRPAIEQKCGESQRSVGSLPGLSDAAPLSSHFTVIFKKRENVNKNKAEYDPTIVKSFEPPIRIIIHSIMLLIFYVMNIEKNYSLVKTFNAIYVICDRDTFCIRVTEKNVGRF